MAGAKSTAGARKRVEATVLKRSRDGSAFTRCEACNKDVPVVLIDMHSCSLDSNKIRMTLEAQVVEKTVEVKKTERKRPAASAAKGQRTAKKAAGNGESKRSRSPTAFFLFMDDFRKEYKATHPENKSVATTAKEGGEKWRSMTEEEKKPYLVKAAELKAKINNDEGSGENNVAVEKPEAADDEEGEQEVDQPAKPDSDDEDKNELDDNLDDDM